jgi:hypothetical protein
MISSMFPVDYQIAVARKKFKQTVKSANTPCWWHESEIKNNGAAQFRECYRKKYIQQYNLIMVLLSMLILKTQINII